jgi:hypothetical protein
VEVGGQRTATHPARSAAAHPRMILPTLAHPRRAGHARDEVAAAHCRLRLVVPFPKLCSRSLPVALRAAGREAERPCRTECSFPTHTPRVAARERWG